MYKVGWLDVCVVAGSVGNIASLAGTVHSIAVCIACLCSYAGVCRLCPNTCYDGGAAAQHTKRVAMHITQGFAVARHKRHISNTVCRRDMPGAGHC